jgi:hypothetical protein
MINNQMTDKSTESQENIPNPVNEEGGIYFSSSFKIFDPNTNEVLVQQRGDN